MVLDIIFLYIYNIGKKLKNVSILIFYTILIHNIKLSISFCIVYNIYYICKLYIENE